MSIFRHRPWCDDKASEPTVERRQRGLDRRLGTRGGRRASDHIRIGVFAALCAMVSSSALVQEPVRFGFDAKSV